MNRWIPWIGLGVAGLYVLASMIQPSDPPGEMRIHEFGKLPLVFQGRVKPFDTLARNSLMQLSGKQSFKDADGKSQPAIRFLLDLLSETLRKEPKARTAQVIKIESDLILSFLGLPQRSGFLYSYSELQDSMSRIAGEVNRARKAPKESRTEFDRRILELDSKLDLFIALGQLDIPHMVPPGGEGDEWKPLAQAIQQAEGRGQVDVQARSLFTILLAYGGGHADDFNKELEAYQKRVSGRVPDEVAAGRFENAINHFQPFYAGLILYIVAFLLAVIGWTIRGDTLNRTALYIIGLTFVVHTAALVIRMYLMDRPWVFVTNLYSSAIFIGWACVIMGLVVERIFRNGIGNVVGSFVGFATLIIAHNLAQGGDTLEMMQAVLDTNFWLSTHVTCITLGYASVYLAGVLGMIYILAGFLSKRIDEETARGVYGITYGILCFATFFSFTGTVLGGIWADQSWGRFWGWDPKENGALMIVLWCALILHARWGGLIRQRGVAVCAVIGNIVTTWSWFGVNLLSVGLHSYGFKDGTKIAILVFVATQLAIITLGLLPLRHWASFRRSSDSGRVEAE